MSGVGEIAVEFARAEAQFERSLTEAGAWNDGQRMRLNRARIDPLQHAAHEFACALQETIDAVTRAEQMLER